MPLFSRYNSSVGFARLVCYQGEAQSRAGLNPIAASLASLPPNTGCCCWAPSPLSRPFPARSSASCSMTRAAGPLVEAEGSRLHPPFRGSNNGGRPTWDRRRCRWIILNAGAARPLTSATRHLDEGTRRKTRPQTHKAQGARTGQGRARRGGSDHILSEGRCAARLSVKLADRERNTSGTERQTPTGFQSPLVS